MDAYAFEANRRAPPPAVPRRSPDTKLSTSSESMHSHSTHSTHSNSMQSLQSLHSNSLDRNEDLTDYNYYDDQQPESGYITSDHEQQSSESDYPIKPFVHSENTNLPPPPPGMLTPERASGLSSNISVPRYDPPPPPGAFADQRYPQEETFERTLPTRNGHYSHQEVDQLYGTSIQGSSIHGTIHRNGFSEPLYETRLPTPDPRMMQGSVRSNAPPTLPKSRGSTLGHSASPSPPPPPPGLGGGHSLRGQDSIPPPPPMTNMTPLQMAPMQMSSPDSDFPPPPPPIEFQTPGSPGSGRFAPPTLPKAKGRRGSTPSSSPSSTISSRSHVSQAQSYSPGGPPLPPPPPPMSNGASPGGLAAQLASVQLKSRQQEEDARSYAESQSIHDQPDYGAYPEQSEFTGAPPPAPPPPPTLPKSQPSGMPSGGDVTNMADELGLDWVLPHIHTESGAPKQVDPKTLAGWQEVPENCPTWKKAMIEKRNKQLEDDAKKQILEVRKEEEKWKGIPDWKKKLIQEKEKKKQEETDEDRRRHLEMESKLASLPKWKADLLRKKQGGI